MVRVCVLYKIKIVENRLIVSLFHLDHTNFQKIGQRKITLCCFFADHIDISQRNVIFLCNTFPLSLEIIIIIIIIIASHPCQGIGHRQTSSTHSCFELSCLEPPTSCQHLSFLFPCIFSMSPVAYPCLSSAADSTEEPVV